MQINSTSPFLATAMFTFLVTGCGLVPGYANLTAKSANNPLAGESLAWSKPAENLPFEGEKACSIWPIEDSVTVKATDAQICVDATLHRLVDAGFSGDKPSPLDVASDGSLNGGGGVVVQTAKQKLEGQPRKIGTCFDKATSRERSVWASKYAGCVPNTDGEGKPVLTAKSTFLEVNTARWKFPATAANAKSEPAAK